MLIDEYVHKVTLDRATVIEERIKLVLRDKPRCLPERLWRALVARLLVIQTGP